MFPGQTILIWNLSHRCPVCDRKHIKNLFTFSSTTEKKKNTVYHWFLQSSNLDWGPWCVEDTLRELEHIFIHVHPLARHEFVPKILLTLLTVRQKKKLIIFRWSSSCVIVDEIGICLREGEIETRLKERNNNRIFSICASCLVPLNHWWKDKSHLSFLPIPSLLLSPLLLLLLFPYSSHIKADAW